MTHYERNPGACDSGVSGNSRAWQADNSPNYNSSRRWRQMLNGYEIGATVLVRHYGIGVVLAGTLSSYIIRIDRPAPGQPLHGVAVLVTDLAAIERVPTHTPNTRRMQT